LFPAVKAPGKPVVDIAVGPDPVDVRTAVPEIA